MADVSPAPSPVEAPKKECKKWKMCNCPECKKMCPHMWMFFILQAITVIFFGVFMDWSAPLDSHSGSFLSYSNLYFLYIGIHIMIFIGFGYLMTFLRKYGYSGLGFCLWVSSIASEFGIFLLGMMRAVSSGWTGPRFPATMNILIEGDFAAAAVMITMGVLLGRVSSLTLVFIAFAEVSLYTLDEWINLVLLRVKDVGGSICIHLFGSTFGLALSLALQRTTANHTQTQARKNPEDNCACYPCSDLFSLIGTLFLWIYWPSFNAALSEEELGLNRALVNTVLSLIAATIAAFYFSKLFRHHHKFDMVDIQNATIAGGVGMGSAADIIDRPIWALLVGLCAGALSAAGYSFLLPRLQKNGFADTCGVINLHFLPGLYGGLIACLFIGLENEVGHALLEFAAIGISLGIASIGGYCMGTICGWFARAKPSCWPFNFLPSPEKDMVDSDEWHVEEYGEEHPHIPESAYHRCNPAACECAAPAPCAEPAAAPVASPVAMSPAPANPAAAPAPVPQPVVASPVAPSASSVLASPQVFLALSRSASTIQQA